VSKWSDISMQELLFQ